MALGFDGSIRIKAILDHTPFNRGLSSMAGQVDKFGATLKKLAGVVGIAFGTAAIVNFGRESIKAASELSNAWIGLQSIVEGQGRSFSKAKSFVEEYVSDGLVPLTDAVTAYKNLAARGYDDEQIKGTMTALKDAAAFGRQSSYSLGEAISTATEGLKNENSILVDNAGVTKNVAKMWDDYARSIGTTANNLTKEQKIQAEVNGILEETKFQTGDAAKLVNTYSGQVGMLGYNFQQLKVQVGEALIPIVQAVLPGINAIIAGLTKLAAVFAKVTALLFGKSSKVTQTSGVSASASAAADSTDKLADSLGAAGDAAKKAGKDMKSVTAPFDEFNILADNAASSASSLAGGLDLSSTDIELPKIETGGELFADAEVSPRFLAEIEALKDALARIGEVFKESWELNSTSVIEAAKRLLTSIYDLLKSIGTAFTEAWTGESGLEFLNAIYAFLTAILNIIADIANALKTAFDNVGTEFVESILFRFTALLKLINRIGDSFREAWNDGAGVEISETIFRILTDINNTYGMIYSKIQQALEANQNGVAIWQAILDFVQTILSFVERLSSATLEWVQGLDLEPLVTSFRGLLEAINPLVEVITDGLAWAYENVLLPLAKWAAEELAPAAVDLLTASIGLLTEVLEVLKPLGEWLWETFLQPLAEWTGEQVIEWLKNFSDGLNNISTWIAEHRGDLEEAFEPFGSILETISETVQRVVEDIDALYDEHIRPFIDSVIGAFNEWNEAALDGWNTYIKPVLDSLAEKFDDVVTNHVVPMVEKAIEILGKVIDAIKLLWDNVLAPFVEWFIQKLYPNISEIIGLVGDVFLTFLATVSDVVGGILEALGGVIDFLTGAFTGDWGRAWNGIKEIFKGVWNTIIGLLEGAANYIVAGINSIISKANKLSFQAPEIFGGGRIGINIPKLSSVELPRLANGAVIPPNQQFAAILGDQRSGMNLEAPADLIKQMVMEGIQAAGGTGGDINVTVESVLDGEVIARNTIRHINSKTRSSGRSPILGAG